MTAENGELTRERADLGAILIIDDHPLYCDALASTLERLFPASQISTTNSMTEGLRAITGRFKPDLIILDLRLPDVAGLSGLFRLRDKMPDVPVLVVSAESSESVVRSLADAGVAGFVTKDANQKTVQDAINTVVEGERYFPEGFTKSRRPMRDTMTEHEIAQKIADLTPQQGRIIQLICAGKPNKQIAYEMSLAEATVKAHITALLRKLGVQNRTQAAVLVRSVHLDSLGQSEANNPRAIAS